MEFTASIPAHPSSHPGRARGRRPAGKAGRRGVTIVETAMAMAILMIGMLGFCRVLGEVAVASERQRDTEAAREAATSLLERLQEEELSSVYARFNADPADDPDGAGTAPGAGFAVLGLQPLEDDPDGLVGEIVFPTEEDDEGAALLCEDLDLPALGLPRDMNADGVIDHEDRSGDYVILPVLLRVRWRSAGGPAEVELKTLLAGY
jgi:hypothetical protein